MTDQLAEFDRRPLRFGDSTYDVYVAGSGPAEKKAHSVLTAEYSSEPEHPTNQAMELVLDHFLEKLLP